MSKKNKCPDMPPAPLKGCPPETTSPEMKAVILEASRMWKAVFYFYNPRYVLRQRVNL